MLYDRPASLRFIVGFAHRNELSLVHQDMETADRVVNKTTEATGEEIPSADMTPMVGETLPAQAISNLVETPRVG